MRSETTTVSILVDSEGCVLYPRHKRTISLSDAPIGSTTNTIFDHTRDWQSVSESDIALRHEIPVDGCVQNMHTNITETP